MYTNLDVILSKDIQGTNKYLKSKDNIYDSIVSGLLLLLFHLLVKYLLF